MQSGVLPEHTAETLKLLKNKPRNWQDCVSIGRAKFEKYFNHKVSQYSCNIKGHRYVVC